MKYSDLLRSLYDGKSQVATSYRDAIRAIEPNRCPYCGKPYPNTLDHFLPRSEFPEFSMYANNLIPSCNSCNLAKSAKVWDRYGHRLFLNPYYDDFMAYEFVHLIIRPDHENGFDVPLFEFEFKWTGMTDEFREICRSHFDRLGISGLLRKHFAAEFRTYRRKYQTKSVFEVRMDLVEWNEARSVEFGPNCWECILGRAILANDEALKFLTS